MISQRASRPRAALRSRALPRLPWPALGAGGLFLAAVAVLTALGIGQMSYQPDEALYTQVAQHVGHRGLVGFFEWDVYQRGIQRLTVWMLAPVFALFDGPGAFAIGHVLQSALYASAAIAAYLLARGLGLRPLAALAAGALSILVPWAIMAQTFLTEPAAYAAFAWLLYAGWVALARPSPRHDAFALLAAALAPLSRTGFVVLLPVLPVAAAIVSWPASGSVPERLRGWPAALWRRHRVLVVVAVFAAVLVVGRMATGGGWSALTGTYGAPPLSDLGLVVRKDLQFLSRLMSGTGLLLGAIALPWLAVGLARVRDAPRHAFAVLAVLLSLALLLQLAGAAPDERYVMYLTIPLAVAGVAAVARREIGALGLAAGTAVVAALVLGHRWDVNGGDFGFYAYPAEQFHHRLLTGRLSVPPLSHLPGDPEHSLVLILVLAACATWVVLGRVRRTGAAVAAVLLALVGWQAIQTGYVLRNFRDKVANPNHIGLGARSFVDRVVPRGEFAGIYGAGAGNTRDFEAIWLEAQFWNPQLRAIVQLGPRTVAPSPYTLGQPVVLQPNAETGRVSVTTGRMPRFLAEARGVNPLGLRARPVAASYLPMDVVEVSRPLRADWYVVGMSSGGIVRPRGAARLRVFRHAIERGRCARMDVTGPPDLAGTATYRVSDAVSASGRVRAQQTRTIQLRLSPQGAYQQIVVRAAGKPLQITGITVGACL